MGRLTKRFRGDVYIEDDCTIRKVLNKLAHYEDMEEQGRLIELPYAVGSCRYIYYADEDDSEVYEIIAEDITLSASGWDNRVHLIIDSWYFNFEDFGKTVFFTKEEAEAKLKELKEDHFTDVDKMGKE